MRKRVIHQVRERRMPPAGLIVLGLAMWLALGLLGHITFQLFG